MSERARRNEIPEHEMIPGAEILVRAEFREDENDDGFTTTRWASLDELATADKNEIEEGARRVRDVAGARAPAPAGRA